MSEHNRTEEGGPVDLAPGEASRFMTAEELADTGHPEDVEAQRLLATTVANDADPMHVLRQQSSVIGVRVTGRAKLPDQG
jgi:hypothetical protein